MHYAAGFGRSSVVWLLLLRGAQATATDSEGKTPLDLATNDDVRRLLRDHMAGNELYTHTCFSLHVWLLRYIINIAHLYIHSPSCSPYAPYILC